MKNDPFPTDADIVKRLREIVAEPQKWCSTDADYVDDAADAIARLTAERDDAREQAERWEDDALRLMTERNKALEERDEARRTLCRIGAAMATLDLQEHSRKELGIHALTTVLETNVASMRGWDCFKEDGK